MKWAEQENHGSIAALPSIDGDKVLSSIFVHKNPELPVGAFTKLGRRHCLSQTNAFGRLWGPTGSVINRINFSVKTVEPNDYNTQKKTCGYDMLVGSGSIALDTT